MGQVPKLISKRTKEGDQVFDGGAAFGVMHRSGLSLVLRPLDRTDYHYYVRNIEGGVKRFNDYQSALNDAFLPAVVTSIELARAEQARV